MPQKNDSKYRNSVQKEGDLAMSINIEEKNILSQYQSYKVNSDKYKQILQRENEKDIAGIVKHDTADISEAGRSALQNRMSDLCGTEELGEVKKLSAISSFGILNDFERYLSELSGGMVSDEFVTENYSQEKVEALKSKFEQEEGEKTDCFDGYVNKMASVYKMMKNDIEEKYANPDMDKTYYVADDGSIQELTKEKELEMLDKAYAKHSEFMATNTEVWSSLKDFQPQITYYSNADKPGTGELGTAQEGYKKNEIKHQAYQAFMSAISTENTELLERTARGLNHLKLNLNISVPTRNVLNSIWDYYANKKY